MSEILERPTKEQAISAARAQAFEETAEDDWEPAAEVGGEQLYRKITPPSQKIVHCFMGGFGADWNLESVEEVIETADELAWIDHLLGHNLGVSSGGKTYCFDVKKPEDGAA